MVGGTDSRHHWSDRAFAAAVGVVSLAALVVFAPWRPPGLVSDTWLLIGIFGRAAPADLAAIYFPSADFWYRPLTYTGFWLEWHIFGIEPLGYHLVALSLHVLASVLIGALALTLVRNRWAALATGVVFLFALQAHEPVWDYASLHRVLSAVVVPATVLAYVHNRRVLALTGAAAALLVDESGIIVLALLGSYELVYRIDRRVWRETVFPSARRIAPIAVLSAVYVAARLSAGGVFNELATPCRTLQCIGVGGLEYLNRLVVRGDELLPLLRTDRPIVAAAVLALCALVLAVAAPWRWTSRQTLAFGIVWAALGSLLFVLTLWPYVADRFVYVPAMGLALASGAVVGGAFEIWPRVASAPRAALVAAALLLVAWVSVGAISIADRGRRWVEAGELARVLRADLYALLPAPAPGTQVLVWDVPRMLQPTFPPGNTGPYVYINGFDWSMRVAYGWRADVTMPDHPELYPEPYPVDTSRPLLEFEVVDGHVVPRPTH